ncbi:MAG: hypothetical protein FWC47_10125 [Oscillospiraceae bacterium]|nr:hypothetical protein [Oscillospiraceae bacterium]
MIITGLNRINYEIINPLSYVLAIVISLGFTVFVNLIMNYRLVQIDMLESLKSVE